MNYDLIDDLIKLTNELFEDKETQFALHSMASVVQYVMSEMESNGEVITRESLHNRIKVLIEKNEKLKVA